MTAAIDTESIVSRNRQSRYYPQPQDNRRFSFRLEPPPRRSGYYYGERPVDRPADRLSDRLGDRLGDNNPAFRNFGGWAGPGPNRQRAPIGMYANVHHQYGPPDFSMQQRDRSSETVGSGAASGSLDQAGYQTDPTSISGGGSDKSFDDQGAQMTKPSPLMEAPRLGFNPSPDSLSVSTPNTPVSPPNEQSPTPANTDAAPQVPPKGALGRRISLLTGISPPDSEKKRSSWLRRRFSKKS